jgi:dienelactone hydrolase
MPTSAARRFLGALVVVLAAGAAEGGVRSSVTEFRSGDSLVTVECFVPTAKGKHPMVLLLHGSGGLEQATGDAFREIAGRMAAKGYVVLIPHYHDRPGDYQASLEVVEDAIAFGAESRVVDPERVGLFGFSAGASMALHRAARDPRVKAVVSVSGSLPRRWNSKFPPVLILHAEGDTSTPLGVVREFTESLKAKGTPYTVHIYRHLGHNLDIPTFFNAGRRAGLFFDKYLKPADPKGKAPSKPSDPTKQRDDTNPGPTKDEPRRELSGRSSDR